jgi:hypothetical protein
MIGAVFIGLLCAAVAAGATLFSGAGFWAVLAAYMGGGSIGMFAGAVLNTLAEPAESEDDPRRKRDLAQWDADDDSRPLAPDLGYNDTDENRVA